MLDARFVINLRNDTISTNFRKTLQVWGYLAPPGGLTRKLLSDIPELVKSGAYLIVDNGLFDDVTRIVNDHTKETNELAVYLATQTARLRRQVKWQDMTGRERTTIKRLATELSTEAATATGMDLQDQLGLSPAAIIGVEDITAALWLRCGLDAPVLGTLAGQLKKRNEEVASRGKRIDGGLKNRHGIDYLPVASALDYDGAFQAGRSFGSAGLRGAAMGFGAFMADDSLSDTITIHGRSRRLNRRLPMRYLRTALVARGFWDGWRSATGGAPKHFHFLGLGAPIMIAVVAVAAGRTPLLTFDATSPIQDAVQGTVYSSLGAYLKIRTRNLAGRLASGVLKTWTCPCGFCSSFVRSHPFDYVAGRAWGERHKVKGAVGARDLQPGGGLYGAYPLFSEPRGGSLRAEVSFARSGHNHWVIEDIVAAIRKHGRTAKTIESFVKLIVEEYRKSTNADYYGEAVSLAFEVAAGRGES